MPTPEESLPQATEAFRAFLFRPSRDTRTTLLCHSDADGVENDAFPPA
jgi:hypothetical protein